MKIYTIRDDAAEYFFSPFVARTDAEAQRMFIQSMGDKFIHRADYKLVCIGEFDEDLGIITTVEQILVLAGLSIPTDKDPMPKNTNSYKPETHLDKFDGAEQ